MTLIENRSPNRNSPLGADEAAIVGVSAVDEARRYLPAFPDYRPTPLVALPSLARSLGLGGDARPALDTETPSDPV